MNWKTLKNIAPFLFFIGSFVAAVYPAEIKNLINGKPTVIVQESNFKHFEEKDPDYYKIEFYNKSKKSGDLSIMVKGIFSVNDFRMKGFTTQPTIETGQGNTYITFQTIYGKQEPEIDLIDRKHIVDHPVFTITSKTFKIDKLFSFPLEQEFNSNSGLIITIIWIVFWAIFFVTIYIADLKNKLKNSEKE